MAAINNPSRLPQSLFEILPLEIIVNEILPNLDPKDLLTLRAVCKIFRREIDYLIRQQWKETKQLPPNNVIPLQEMMKFLETNYPNAAPLTLFSRLAKLFSDTYGIHIHQPTVPCSATEIANLQTIAKQQEDQSLITFWDRIRLQLNLLAPLQTADAIRAWMNDPANAGQLNSIITLHVVMGNFKTIPSEIRLLTQLRHLTLAYNKITAIPDAISALTQLQVFYLARNQITEIPDAIRDLTQLRYLNLAHNKITVTPD
ncbi:MAG TPA: leucine-rich repeat domain-containing protein, partial [Rhabdochlamydiaceae bacterium]|nr:leucine-rich repeat domain-containing protein [Rhabdochlamydiaceae bacterium]